MRLDLWISTHPYLRPIADFSSRVTEAVNHIPITTAHIPNWVDYTEEYKQGLPMLRSSHVAVDYEEVARIVSSLLEQLSSVSPSESLTKECQDLSRYFRGNSAELQRAVGVLLLGDGPSPLHPGLFRHIAWSAMLQYLNPLLSAFQNWRDEESWSYPYCPVCGSGPSMTQLVGADSGRRRLLVCGCCGTRWSFPRMRCPFCENTNDHRLFVLVIEGEKHLRIDYCGVCQGYLKTYEGKGAEGVLLADWTSLHLDVLAQDRGLRRLAASLYEL
jgi:FdhE protein